jgi:D-glycero-D-manno-heptose 1,7-bisphosphate phosphatase
MEPETMSAADPGPVILLDLEGVIIERRPGRLDPPYSLRPAADEGLRRLAQVTDHLIALVEPPPLGSAKRPRSVDFLDGIRAPMVKGGPPLRFVACPHPPAEGCSCRKPQHGLIDIAVARYGIHGRETWHISGDQEGVQAGRSAGLHTIRVGPPSEDHLTAVHRADYEARDLLDAANWILVRSLAAGV